MPGLGSAQRRFLNQVRAYVSVAEGGGVSGAVMLAQAALESNWGRSGLARVGNAYFGVKATPLWPGSVYSGTTKEWVRGEGYRTISGTHRRYARYTDAIADGCHPQALFRAYESLDENVRDYVRFFHRQPRYRAALGIYALTRDPRQFAIEIARAGYATSPTYAHTLLGFMERVAADLLPAAHPFVIRVNGATIPPEGVLIVNGRVYAHVRRLAGALGMTVRYDHTTKTVHMDKEGRHESVRRVD